MKNKYLFFFYLFYFIFNNRFIGGNKSRQGAYEMAKLAVEA